MTRPTRRRLLAATGLVLGPLAGCLGDDAGNGDDDAGDGDGAGGDGNVGTTPTADSTTETTTEATTTAVTTTSATTTTPAGDHRVEMTDDLRYDPDRLEVDPGDTVVWENVGTLSHTVTAYGDELPERAAFFASGGFDSQAAAREAYPDGDVSPESTFAHTFEAEGVYEYFCVPHETAGMTGTVVVGSPSTSTTTTTSPTTTPDGSAATVELSDTLTFSPETIEVEAGSTVRWENVGAIGHTVTAYGDEVPDGAEYFASGGFDSEDEARSAYPDKGPIPGGETYRHTFETAGTYEYFCIPHEGAGMTGVVRVI